MSNIERTAHYIDELINECHHQAKWTFKRVDIDTKENPGMIRLYTDEDIQEISTEIVLDSGTLEILCFDANYKPDCGDDEDDDEFICDDVFEERLLLHIWPELNSDWDDDYDGASTINIFVNENSFTGLGVSSIEITRLVRFGFRKEAHSKITEALRHTILNLPVQIVTPSKTIDVTHNIESDEDNKMIETTADKWLDWLLEDGLEVLDDDFYYRVMEMVQYIKDNFIERRR